MNEVKLFYTYIPYFLGIPITVTTSSPNKKEYKISLARLLSKVFDNNFSLCKIDSLSYELKHCPAANPSMRAEYNKCCESKFILRMGKQEVSTWPKTFKYPEEIMQCFEINKFYVKLLNCKIFLHMINEKKLL